VVTCPGVERLPFLDGVFMDRWRAPNVERVVLPVLCSQCCAARLQPCASMPLCIHAATVSKPRRYAVNAVWKVLPWNGGPFDGRPPVCRMRVVYVDEQMRISRDAGGGLFVYTRPMATPTMTPTRGPGGDSA
jgi:hypothetical protein